MRARARPGRASTATRSSAQRVARRRLARPPREHPCAPRDRHLAARRHPRPGRPHHPGHRDDARRARPPHRARAGPPRGPGGPRRAQPGQARRDRATPSAPRCRPPSSSTSRSTSPTSASVRRAGDGGRGVRPDRRAGQQRRGHGHVAYQRHRRRPRPAAGDQPLRAVPADRAAAAAAGGQQGRDRGDGVLADAPGGPRRARSATRTGIAAVPQVARLRADQARQPAVHLRARPPGPTAELPVKALAAHPGFAGTHLAANGQYGRSGGGIASILDADRQGASRSRPRTAPGRR